MLVHTDSSEKEDIYEQAVKLGVKLNNLVKPHRKKGGLDMVILLILIALIALVFVGSVFLKIGQGTNRYGSGEKLFLLIPGTVLIIVGVLAALIWGMAWGFSYLGSYDTIQEMRAFQNETMSAYEYSIVKTENVVIDISGTRQGAFTDFSYQEQGKAVSERVKELRDQVTWFNSTYYSYQGKNRIPIIGNMYYDVPEDLHPIRLTNK